MILVKEGKICMKGNISIHINIKNMQDTQSYISITKMVTPYINYEYNLCSKDTLICMNIDTDDYYYTLYSDHNVEKISIEFYKFGSFKYNNNLINCLMCSDENYFVAMFASLHSVVKNTNHLEKLHMNFIIPYNSNKKFYELIRKYNKTIKKINYSTVFIHENLIDKNIKKSKCYKGGNHLLNLANFSRLLIGELYNYEKLIYLDSDSITQCDLYEKMKNIKIEKTYYSLKLNKDKLTASLGYIINKEYNWKKLVGYDIDMDVPLYMGAPFITNCKKWKNVFKKIIYIVKAHNKEKNGLYKLFTMSLQNIIFHKESDDIMQFINPLPDCGSLRKNWKIEKLKNADVLDWSGNLKPWFKNGLFKNIWKPYDVLKLSNIEINTEDKKNTIENSFS